MNRPGAIRAAIARGRRRTRVRGAGFVSRRAGDGFEFSELREYTAGDDPRRIDWAASARTGDLQTRVYRDEDALVFAAILDDTPSMHLGRSRRLTDAAAEALDAWFGALERDDRAFRIAGGAIVTAPVMRGLRAGRFARDARASTPFSLEAELRAACALPRAAATLVISDFLESDGVPDELLRRVATRCEITALIARDPWYDGLPLRGFVRLRDAETGVVRRYYIGRQQRSRYRAAVREREDALRARLEAAGWQTGILDETDGRTALLAALGAR